MVRILLSFFCALFLSAMSLQAQTEDYVSVDCPSASSGSPQGPGVANTEGVIGAATVIPDDATTGATDYAFLITDIADSLRLLAVTYDGAFDFVANSLTYGRSYGFHGIAYKQTELVTVSGLICALTPPIIAAQFGITEATAIQIDQFICGGDDTADDPNLGKLLGLVELLAGRKMPMDSVAAQLNTIAASNLVSVCYAVSKQPDYTVNYGTVGIENPAVQNLSLNNLGTDRIVLSGEVQNAQDLHISLFDLNGKIVNSQSIAAAGQFQADINIDNLPAAAYVLRIQTNEGISVAKIVKQ